MECECGFDANPDFLYELLGAKTVRARVTHQCGECRRAIEIGENYYSESLAGEGHVFTEKTCLDCFCLRESFCDTFLYGEVREMIREGIGEQQGRISEDCIAPLTPAAREWVCGIIQGIFEDDEQWEDDDAEL